MGAITDMFQDRQHIHRELVELTGREALTFFRVNFLGSNFPLFLHLVTGLGVKGPRSAQAPVPQMVATRKQLLKRYLVNCQLINCLLILAGTPASSTILEDAVCQLSIAY